MSNNFNSSVVVSDIYYLKTGKFSNSRSEKSELTMMKKIASRLYYPSQFDRDFALHDLTSYIQNGTKFTKAKNYLMHHVVPVLNAMNDH